MASHHDGPTDNGVAESAIQLASAGLSVLPIACDGTKKPPVGQSWKQLQEQIASPNEIRRMFRGQKGIGIICGAVSGNLETLDIDAPELVEPFEAAVSELAPGLLERLNVVASPRDNWGGRHYRYRIPGPVAGNTKLAETELRPKFQSDGTPEIDLKTGKQRLAPHTLIETRGEGGYAIAPGSPAECHELCLPYKHISGPSLTEIPTITAREHQILWDVAKTFNRYIKPNEVTDAPKKHRGGDSPGDAFCASANWDDLLVPAGWTKSHSSGPLTFWRRPGKEIGTSATTGVVSSSGTELFCVFSSNAHPFDGAANGRPCSSYSKFAVYTILNHDGDYSAAAKALRKEGYGDGGDDDDQVEEQSESGGKLKKTVATALVDDVLASGVELWHTPGGDTFVTFPVADHVEHVPVRSRAFRRWVSHRHYVANRRAPSAQTIADAIAVLDGKAAFEGAENLTFVRIAEHVGNIYVDLCDSQWRVIEITPSGWQITKNSPVRFRRPRAMLALPEPVHGGHVDGLREFLNVDDDDWILTAAWLAGTMRPKGPFASLFLHGEQGSAKSTAQRLIRSLTDNNEALLRAEPRDPRDLMIAANNGWVVSLDNLSYLPPWLSDALCRLSTGGGFSTRALYENDEEIIFNAMRPVVLNGIEEVISRSDLIDRSLMTSLHVIPASRRRPEAEIWRAFAAAQPRILGGLLDAVASALRELPKVDAKNLPRMADFAVWAVAAERSLGLETGDFLHAYTGNRHAANELALEMSPVFRHVRTLLDEADGYWSGSAGDLLAELEEMATDKEKRQKTWPSAGHVLSGKLTRIAPNLRAVGIEVENGRTKHGRFITLRTVAHPSVTSVTGVTSPEITGVLGDAPADAGDGEASPGTGEASPANGEFPDENFSGDADDAGDASLRTPSVVRLRV